MQTKYKNYIPGAGLFMLNNTSNNITINIIKRDKIFDFAR